jgi:predicted ATPase
MISNIKIKGLKSIDELELTLKNLNLFIGTNSSGKSTIIQSLLIASQNIDKSKSEFNGSLVSLGDFREVRNFVTNAKSVSIGIEDSQGNHQWEFFEEEDSIEKNTGKDCDFKFDDGLYYLSASRIGYMDTYEKNIKKVYKFGIQGEYCFSYFIKNKDKLLDEPILIDNVSKTLDYNVNYWFEHIINAKLVATDIQQTDRLKVQFSGSSGREVRTKNIGSGLGYLISIIIMCLSIEAGDTLIIENPEIHLHPKAQSKLLEFLVFISKSNRQLIIETHSDHIFNGIRVAIVNGKLTNDDVSLNFLSLNEKNCTDNREITVGKRGRIINGSRDLFDQFEIDLDRMLGI